ncbi:hypothetical protein Daus18300_001073 [Diaporthe australafricana]|uniref:Trichothecene 3-O-acetyltransferase-like N-terminal domain-containing protein n=1 Tax=Diaporthe australafricana TaxID=127596 RepID=A0ABR3XYX4_9PEZI
MSQGNENGDDDLHQDVLGQLPFLDGYTHVLCGFQTSQSTSRDEVVASLHASVAELCAKIPWLGWRVTTTSGHGKMQAQPWPEIPGGRPYEMIRVKECDTILASFSELWRAGIPMTMLDRHVLTPFPGLPEPHGLDPPPVATIQVNFIRGGVMLNLSVHHSIMDAPGIMQFTKLLAATMEGRGLTEEDIRWGNMDRGRVVPLIPRGEPIKDHTHLRRPPGYVPRPPASACEWCYFKMPLAAFTRLKKLASADKKKGEAGGNNRGPLISDDDLLSAFYWKRVTAVRLARGSPLFKPETVSMFSRAIDARQAMGVPFQYMGQLIYHSATHCTMEQIRAAPLTTLAAAMRRDLSAANNPWAIRSYATHVAREPDKSQLMYGGMRNFDTDLGGSSVNTPFEGPGSSEALSFGPLLGKLRFFRRPRMLPFPGCVYIVPPENGSILMLVCLAKEDLEGLRNDAEWKSYTRYIG